MNDPFRNKNKHQESVISDNKFHRQLSDVRNRDVIDNHPDIELLKQEAQQQSQRHLATLYRLPAMKDPEALVGESTTKMDAGALARYKPPSSVSNFHDCMRALEREAKRSWKFQRPFTLMIVGFNDIQYIVNTYGVLAYDQCLGHIDSVLCNIVDTDIDTVGRYSNDRFMVLLPECAGPNSTLIAETARQYFETVPIVFDRHSFHLKASIGLACFPNHGTDWKEILAKADLACEAVLAKGGNAFGFASGF